MAAPLVRLTDSGLFCEAGSFHIDPWKPVERALITHAHADHARTGSQSYLAAEPGELLLRTRLGQTIDLQTLAYEETLTENGVLISFHPAGHVLGSAQIRLEHQGEVWVISGDYKCESDATCGTFTPVRCHTFITESTFGLPIYRWQPQREIFDQINTWWNHNREHGRGSMILAYSLGKAQRVLAGIDATIGPIWTHGAVERVTRAYRDSGVSLPETIPVSAVAKGTSSAGALIIAPPSAAGTPWSRKLEPLSMAMASGWMHVRGARRRRALDRGFVLSDHADWPGLVESVRATGAERVLATHGQAAVFARWLREQGIDADVIATRFGDDEEHNDVEEGSE